MWTVRLGEFFQRSGGPCGRETILKSSHETVYDAAIELGGTFTEDSNGPLFHGSVISCRGYEDNTAVVPTNLSSWTRYE